MILELQSVKKNWRSTRECKFFDKMEVSRQREKSIQCISNLFVTIVTDSFTFSGQCSIKSLHYITIHNLSEMTKFSIFTVVKKLHLNQTHVEEYRFPSLFVRVKLRINLQRYVTFNRD